MEDFLRSPPSTDESHYSYTQPTREEVHFNPYPVHISEPASPMFSTLDPGADFDCPSPVPSEMPGTPVMSALSNDEYENEARLEDVTRRLNSHGAHQDDVIEALRLGQWVQTPRQSRTTPPVTRRMMGGGPGIFRGLEPPLMRRSLAMFNGERVS
jgi:hypothetical protein